MVIFHDIVCTVYNNILKLEGAVGILYFLKMKKIKTTRNITATVVKVHDNGTYDIEYKKGDQDLKVFLHIIMLKVSFCFLYTNTR